MTEDKNSYRNITKSIGIFGGTKIFQILVGLVKNKIIALLLGPVGMGIQGMLTSTTQLVSAFTGLGLHTSAVRDVAQSSTSGDQNRVTTTLTILRKLVLGTGLLGTILTFIFAETLSEWSFGNTDFTTAFRIISITLFFDQIVIGQRVLLQGTFHYKYMAVSSLWGSVVGLILCVPLYFFGGVKAIVPVIIITSIANLVIVCLYARKVSYQKKHLSLAEIWSGGKVMISLGLAIALVAVLGNGTTYIVRAYLTNFGSLEVVGLYTAGSAFVTQYINVVFEAMGSDYTPRLAAVANDEKLFVEVMNRQAVMLITIVSPLIILFVLFAEPLVLLLFSSQFIEITGMIEWMMGGMLFRAISWALSFSFTAKGDSKMFFLNELISSCYSLPLTIIGYKFLGFTGIGMGFCLTYMLYTIQEYIITHRLFKFHFSTEVKRRCFPMILLCFTSVIVLILIKNITAKYFFGLVLLVLISVISYKWLDEMINLKESFRALKKRIL